MSLFTVDSENLIALVSLTFALIALIVSLLSFFQSYNLFSYGTEVKKDLCDTIQSLEITLRQICTKDRYSKLYKWNYDYTPEINSLNSILLSYPFGILSDYLEKKKQFPVSVMIFELLGWFYNGGKPNISICKELISMLRTLDVKDYKSLRKRAKQAKTYSPTMFLGETITDKIGDKTDEDKKRELFKPEMYGFFVWLYDEKKIKDPDLKFWYGVLKHNSSLIKEAISEGASYSTTDNALYNKYKEHFDDYRASFKI